MKNLFVGISLLFTFSIYSQQVDASSHKLKGVIELGSEGFNSFVIQLDPSKNWSLIKSQFDQSYLMEDGSKVSISSKLESYIKTIRNEGVNPKDIHFIVSSGAFAQEATKAVLDELKQKNYIVNVVSSEKEGQLAFNSVIPDSQRDKTMMIDVGSSNTKISWYENDNVRSLSTYGSKYFKNDVADSTVFIDLKRVASQMPKNRSKVAYLIGGMPYKYAKQTRQGTERYTKLNALESYNPKDEKEYCGTLILKELRDAASIEEFIFDWDSNFSIGFLLELPY